MICGDDEQTYIDIRYLAGKATQYKYLIILFNLCTFRLKKKKKKVTPPTTKIIPVKFVFFG